MVAIVSGNVQADFLSLVTLMSLGCTSLSCSKIPGTVTYLDLDVLSLMASPQYRECCAVNFVNSACTCLGFLICMTKRLASEKAHFRFNVCTLVMVKS